MFEQAKRSAEEGGKYGFDGPTKVKEVNLVGKGETPKPVYIAKLLALSLEFQDCFAWTYKDMKGVPPKR